MRLAARTRVYPALLSANANVPRKTLDPFLGSAVCRLGTGAQGGSPFLETRKRRGVHGGPSAYNHPLRRLATRWRVPVGQSEGAAQKTVDKPVWA
jgi:hypothetical protein